MEEFKTYLRAGYPVLYVSTHEEDRAVNTLAGCAGCYSPYTWDMDGGDVKIKDREEVTK